MRAKLLGWLTIIMLSGTQTFGQTNEYHLVWSDEFDVNGAPNPIFWNKEVNGTPANNELQYYVDSAKNSFVRDGYLYLRTIKESLGGKNYTSARLNTRNKVDWTYGRIDVRAKLPRGKGTWPAIWMLYTNNKYGGWPNSGEIDIMEYVGYDSNYVHGTIHSGAYNHTKGTQKGASYYVTDAEDVFHEYSCEWDKDTIEVFIDNIKYFTFVNDKNGTPDTWPFDHNFYLILNIAFGGSWGGAQGIDNSIFKNDSSVQMLVDYVRLYKKNTDFSISGNNKVKESSSNKYSVPQLTGFYYQWIVPTSANATSKSDSSSINVIWGCTSDTLALRIGKDGDTSLVKFPVTVTPLVAYGRNWVDTGAVAQKYYADSIPGATFKWKADAGINITSPDTRKEVWVDFINEGKIYVEISTLCKVYYDTIYIKFGDGQFPYPDKTKPATIPGKIMAINFDYGGPEVAYRDGEKTNQGGAARNDEWVDTQQNDGSYTIGWFNTNEWLEYTVNITEAGTYKVVVRASSGNTAGGSFNMYIDDKLIVDKAKVPGTGSWTTFTNVTSSVFNLPAGKHVLRVKSNGGFNLGNMTFSKANSIKQEQTNATIALFPNPAKDYIIISNLKSVNSNIEIIAIDGKTQKIAINHVDNQYTVNIKLLSKGLYFLKITSGNKSEVHKFVKE